MYRELLHPCLGLEGPHYKLIFHCVASPKADKQEEGGGNFLFAIESSGKHLAGKIWKGERNRLRDLKAVLSCSNFLFERVNVVISSLQPPPSRKHRDAFIVKISARHLLGLLRLYSWKTAS